MYLTKLRSNIKGLENGIMLSQRTCLYGPVGSGKTAVVQAIQYLLSAEVDDIAGRDDVKVAYELVALTSDGEAPWVEAFDDTGARLYRDNKTVEIPKEWAHKNVLPVETVADSFTGASDKALAAIARAVPTTLGLTDLIEKFPGELSDYVTEALVSLPKSASWMTACQHVVSYADSQMRACTKEIKDLETQAKGASNVAPPTQAKIAALKAAAHAAHNAAITGDGLFIHAPASQMINVVQSWKNEIATLNDAILAAQADTPLPTPQGLSFTPEQRTRIQAAALIAKHALTQTPVTCGVCGSSHDQLPARMHKIVALHHGIASAPASQVGPSVEVLQAKLAEATETRTKLLAFIATLEEMLDAPNVLSATWATVRGALMERMQAYADAKAIASVTVAHAQAQTQIPGIKLKHGAWKQVKEVANKAMLAGVNQIAETFTNAVTGYLPDGYWFDVSLDKRVRFGLTKTPEWDSGGVVRHAMSGGQWAMVTAAMGAVIGGSTAHVLLPEERSFDRATLRDWIQALKTAPGQIIITATVKPAGKQSAGWEYVDVEEAPFVEEWLGADAPPPTSSAWTADDLIDETMVLDGDTMVTSEASSDVSLDDLFA